MTRVKSKFQRMVEVRRLYLTHPEGLSDDELAVMFNVNRTSILRIRHEMDGMIRVRHGFYCAKPTDEEIKLAQAILKS